MCGSARYAISTEETRYYLNGIFFHVLEDELLAVATDGHRLARIISNKPEGIEIDGIIIPRKCVGEVMKIVDEVEGNVGIELSRSEEHTSELQSLMRISYAVFCLKKKKQTSNNTTATKQNKY